MSGKKIKYLSFYIPEELKQEWMAFAKKLGRPLTKIIREAMNQIMYRESTKEQVDQIAEFKNEILTRMEERDSKIEELLSQANFKGDSSPAKISNLEERILSYLQDVGVAKSKKVALILGEEELYIHQILVDMKNKNKLYYNNVKNIWGIQ